MDMIWCSSMSATNLEEKKSKTKEEERVRKSD